MLLRLASEEAMEVLQKMQKNQKKQQQQQQRIVTQKQKKKIRQLITIQTLLATIQKKLNDYATL